MKKERLKMVGLYLKWPYAISKAGLKETHFALSSLEKKFFLWILRIWLGSLVLLPFSFLGEKTVWIEKIIQTVSLSFSIFLTLPLSLIVFKSIIICFFHLKHPHPILQDHANAIAQVQLRNHLNKAIPMKTSLKERKRI